MIHLVLIKSLLKSMLQFMIGVFHSKERKQNDLIFASPGLLKVLLNPLKRKICCMCFLNNPNSSNENTYKSYKNKPTHSLRVAKRLYYKKQIEKLKSNVKATWKVLNESLIKFIEMLS